MAISNSIRRYSTALAITDPLVKYQAAVATGLYAPDLAQHRLARHLQKIYLRVKDYAPQEEYSQRLRQVARLTETTPEEEEKYGSILAFRSHAIWRNPLFRHLLTTPEGKDSLAMTRILTNYETAMEIDSPKGLFLSGEVGTGKSMLLDLLAGGLPTEKKRRWHFNTFMLYTLSQLEQHRKSHPATGSKESEYSLLWMAKKLVEDSPVLFLDEFQLPDRAASKILSHLFIGFFQLGGVLIASSNRMPEELQKATGVDYTPAPAKGLIRKFFGSGARARGDLFGQSSDFANFLEVLKARCDFWQMEGAKDWRRKEEVESEEVESTQVVVGGVAATSEENLAGEKSERRKKPSSYYLMIPEEDQEWKRRTDTALALDELQPEPWKPSTLVVYGRKIHTPQHHDGFVLWNFDDLVESFGPADYITMASTYHTFIIDAVPILTLAKKNEARRFITLLDALYEARCKLIIRAQNPPDTLFFPESKDGSGKKTDEFGNEIYAETVAEVYQDQTSPFRPNVSFYDTASSTAKYDPDQDSDFGLAKKPLDFGNTGVFTGEDERFAYKRAISRLWELCSAQWHARTGDWWQPLPLEARHWEGGPVSRRADQLVKELRSEGGEGMGASMKIDEVAGLSKWRVEDLKTQSEKSG